MRNLQLLIALFLVPLMAHSQSDLFIKYDSACMDRYEYQLGDNPNVKSFVTYSIKASRNEKVVLEVGIESIKMQSKLPKGTKLKTCKNLNFNQQLVNRINNKEVKVYMVQEIGGQYNLSVVSIASLYREENGELTFMGNNYNFTFNPTKHTTGDNLSGPNSDSDIFYHGREPYQCTEAIKFQRVPIEICCCSFTDLIYVPKIGIIMEQGGNPSEGTKENALNLRAIDGVAFGQYLAEACGQPKPVEEVVVSREPVVYDVIQEKIAPPPPPTVSYGLLVEQTPDTKTVSFVPYELMVAEPQVEVKPTGYGMIKPQEAEPVPYEIVTTVTEKGAIPKPCDGESSAGTHIVQPGESLYGIARIYGANVKNIQTWNNLKKEEVIHPCTRLYVVPPPSTNTVTETFATRTVAPVSYETVQERIVLCNEISTERAHVVQQGENLLQIARQYGLSIEQLKTWNNIRDVNYLEPCSKLNIRPITPTGYDRIVLRDEVAPVSRCPEASSAGYHVVQPKENLTQIASLYGLSVEQIRAWNELSNKDVIPVCTKLRLVSPIPTSYEVITERVVPESRCAEQSTPGTHIVQPKENLTQIAALYDLSVKNLKAWNNISDANNIPVCTRLRLVPQLPTSYEVVTERVVPTSKCPQSSTAGMHIVQPKETLNQIAAMYSLSIEQLKAWNNISDKNVIPVCSELRLVPPAPTAYQVITERIVTNPVPAPKRCEEQSTPGTHVIQPQETLTQIAELYGLSLQDLRKWNQLKSANVIPACTRLRLTAPAPTSYEFTEKSATKCTEKSSKGQHVVQAGETLYAIAKKYKVAIEDLQAWNGLGNTTYLAPCMKVYTVRPADYGQTKKSPVNVSPTQTRIIEKETVIVPNVPMDCNAVSSNGIHVVKKGESLFSLSKKYKVTIAQLQAWNGLGSSVDILPCMKLITKETKPTTVKTTTAPTSYETVTTRVVPVPAPQPKAPVVKAQPQPEVKETVSTRSITYDTHIKCPEVNSPGVHIVRFEETLTGISNLYGISVAQLRAWNGMKEDDVLRVCTPLSIVRPANYEINAGRMNTPDMTDKSGNVTTIVVPPSNPQPQTQTRTTVNIPNTPVASDGRRVHVVRSGETIESIARTYQIAPERLRSANLMEEKELITPGQKLYLN